jgi:hypothetical protein
MRDVAAAMKNNLPIFLPTFEYTKTYMMKKYILLLVVSLTLWNQPAAQAQICTPDTAVGKLYIYPPVLAFAVAGYYYTQVLTFRVPRDTVISTIVGDVPAVVDSAKVLAILGIPPGYFFNCQIPSCTWPGGSLGCGLLAGTSDSAGSAVGSYPIKVYVGSWVRAASTSFYRIDSSSSYTFKVLPYTGGFEVTPYKLLNVYPNPTDDVLNIELTGMTTTNNRLAVYDAQGKCVFEKVLSKPYTYQYTESISLADWPKGVYQVILQTENGNTISKVIRQ